MDGMAAILGHAHPDVPERPDELAAKVLPHSCVCLAVGIHNALFK
jgi:hypothetical protein